MHRVPYSKTAIPRVPAGTVARPQLYADLDRGADCALTLVSAPPGYGKTLLLADWIRRRPDVRTGWVCLDGDDVPPARLWAAVLRALVTASAQTSAHGSSDELDHLTDRWSRRTLSPGDDVELVADLLGTLGNSAQPLRLVIDGADHLQHPRVVEALTALVRVPHHGLRLVLAGRSDPPLPVGRLRMEGRLRELRMDDLRFTVAEAAELVRGNGVRLTGPQVDLLHSRTGGWAAGLRLAVMRLREHTDPTRFLDGFSGGQRSVADYLTAEIMAHLGDDERELLRRVSVADGADGVPAALAVEISGREDAAAVLDRVGQRTGFLVAASGDGGAYRIQELLRSYLVSDLQRRGPDCALVLHRRAARWWAARGRPVEALRHAMASRDAGLLVDLVERSAAGLIARGEHTMLGRLSGALGPASSRWLPLSLAAVRLGEGRDAEAVDVLRRARRAGPVPAGSDLAAYRDAVEGLCGVPADRRVVEDTAPSGNPALSTDPALAALWLAGRGAAALVAGRSAVAGLETALALSRDHGLVFLEAQTLCLLGAAEWTAGNFARAVERATAGVTASAPDSRTSTWATTARVIVAYTDLLAGRPRHLLAEVSPGPDVSSRGSLFRLALHALRGAALFDAGARAGGLDELHRARVLLDPLAPPPALAAAVALLEQHCALQLGHVAEATGALGWLATRADAPAELALGRARAEIHGGREDRARTIIAPVLGGALGDPLLPGTTIEAWLLEAHLAFRADERPTGRHALHAALTLAESRDVVRPFASVGRDVAEHLVDLVGGKADRTGFAARVLATLGPATHTPSCSVALSPREHDVLVRLPSRDSLDEIAGDLGVSVNTVKTHLRSIYVKLGVTGRRAAVLAAHDRGALV